MVPAGDERWPVYINKLHMVHVQVERVLPRSHQVPLLHLIHGHVHQEVIGSREVLAADGLPHQQPQSVRLIKV